MGWTKHFQWPCRLDQYAIAKFAKSFQMIPRTLAENVGFNAGIDLEEGVCKDVSTLCIWDLHVTK